MDGKQKRALAKNIYLNTNSTIKSIANQCDVTEKTLRAWIAKYGWDKEKAADTITPEKLLHETYAQLDAINKTIRNDLNGVPTKQLSDAKGVLIKEIEALSNYPLHRYIAVMNDFMVWLSKNEPKPLRETASLMNRFIESMATKEGVL